MSNEPNTCIYCRKICQNFIGLKRHQGSKHPDLFGKKMKQPVDEFLEKQKYSLYTQQAAEKMLAIAVECLQKLEQFHADEMDMMGQSEAVDALEQINAIASEALE